MRQPEKRSHSRRSYPAVYEKLIPIALGIIVVATIVAIGFAVAVAVGLVQGTAP